MNMTSGDTTGQSAPQAVILAAGFARRMQPLSNNCHKALLPINGTTILGRTLESLADIGVQRVTIVTGYRDLDIRGYVEAFFPQLDVRYVHNERFRDTNNVVSLSMAFDAMEFDLDVVLIECDLLFEPTLLRRLMANRGHNVALVDAYRTGMDGTVVDVEGGLVSAVYPTDSQGPDFSYHGRFKTLNIYRFDREFCQNAFAPLLRTYAHEIDASCYYELVLGMLNNIRAHRVSAEVVTGESWAEVDDPNDLAVATFQFEPQRRSEILDRSFGGHWNFDVLDFSLMRNAHFPTGSMLANMRFALPELVSNYGSTQTVLNEKLGFFLKCSPLRLQVLHGASQIFPLMGRRYGGASVLAPGASFGEYTRWLPGATIYEDAPGVDWASVEAAAPDHDMVVFVNPNTSTGTTRESSAIHELARRCPETLFWVDESFLAFSGLPSMVSLLESEPLDNVVVLVSLSKCLGVPGLRLGYVYSTDLQFVASIGDDLPIWNLSAPAEFMLELMLKFGPAYTASIERTVADREAMRRHLATLPFVRRVPPSGGNFLLIELDGAESSLAARTRAWLLENHSIQVKDVTEKFSDGLPRLRVAVRTADENARLIDALGSFAREADAAL